MYAVVARAKMRCATVIVGVGQHFGMEITTQTQRVFRLAGERLFMNMTGLFRTREELVTVSSAGR